MQTDNGGYPCLNLYNLGFCVPDENCAGCQWPGDYHNQKILNEEQTPKGPTVIDAFKAILEHEVEAEADPTFDKWEWRMQRQRVIWAVERGEMPRDREEKAHKFLKQYSDFLKKFGIDYYDLYPLVPIEKSNKEEFPPEIKEKALNILKTGNPVQYIADGCGKLVLGAEKAFKKLTCCISVQNVKSSSGLHPKLSGDSSGGKTFTVYTFAHHLPREAVIKGSMSAKAGFYHKDGDRVFRILDDYQAGNEDLDTVIKQTSSEFHATYQHRTVINHMPSVMEIGSEQTWAITSVDSSQEIQVLNRQMPINADDSIELTIEVNNLTIKRYCLGESQYPIIETVLVSRCIMQLLRDEGYIDVRIPFEDRIEWIDTSNRRNPSIFMDLVIAHTAMNRYQRAKDSDGCYLATDDDFLAAKALFTDKDGEELVKRLTARERDVIGLLVANSEGLTRDEIAEKLKVAPDRISQILNGQKGYGGLKQKIQIRETKRSDSIRVGNKETDDERRTVHKTIYSLQDYDKFAGFDAVVKLKPAPDEPPKQAKHELSKELSKENSTPNDDLSKISKKEKEKEKRDTKDISGLVEEVSRENEKNAKLLSSKAQHTESQCLADAKPCLVCLADAQDVARGEHFKDKAGKPPLICAKCGAALVRGQDGFAEMTGPGGTAYYCTKNGCAYEKRDEVKP